MICPFPDRIVRPPVSNGYEVPLVDTAVPVGGDPARLCGRHRLPMCALVLVALAVLLTGCHGESTAPDSASARVPDGSWTDVVVGDLVTETPYDGVVGPAGTAVVQSSATGTITREPSVGTTLDPGDVALYVDESAVVALPGDVPVFRDLLAPSAVTATGPAGDATASSTPVPSSAPLQGSDVEQLQRFLAASGYFTGTIDGRFSAALGRSSRAWRTKHGMSALPGFRKQDLLFIPGAGPWTVTKVPTSLGQSFSGGPVIEVSTGGLAVSVSLDKAPPDDATYEVSPAQGSGTTEPVPLDVAVPATRTDDGKYAVTLVPLGSAVLGAAIGTSVIVEQKELLAAGVVSVPVAAIRLDASGRPVARCREADAAARECALTLGATDGQSVEVRSGLTAGMQVAVSP